MTGEARDELDRLCDAVVLAGYVDPAPPAWLLRRIEGGLGGVCLFAHNLRGGVEPVTAALHGARETALAALDEEGGDVTRLEATTGSSYPSPAALGAAGDPALTREVAACIGADLRAAGVDLDIAPVADVNVDPANPVIGVRSFGADAHEVASHVAAAVTGLQSAGVAACAKHFPGHGDTRVDSHEALPVVDVDRHTLDQRELVPFRAAIGAGVATIMTAHLVVPALDSAPATTSRAVMQDLLRRELAFGGAVITDALEMGGAGGLGAVPTNAAAALRAGADLLCLGARIDAALLDAVRAELRQVAGEPAGEARLAEAAARVAAIRQPQPSTPPTADRAAAATAARRALRVTGDLQAVAGAHVVRIATRAGWAAGPVPWGIGAELAAVDAATTCADLAPGEPIDATVAAAVGRPLVVVTRDAHRQPLAAATLAALAAARPDLVEVELGWPDPAPPRGAARVTTHGAGRASAAAAAELLVAPASAPTRSPLG